MFDRIVAIQVERVALEDVGLDRGMLKKLNHLSKVSLTTGFTLIEKEPLIAEVKAAIPECRLKSVKDVKEKFGSGAYVTGVEAEIDTSTSFCCSNVPETK